MTKIFVSSVINAPVEKVWQTIGDFEAVADWNPVIPESSIENFEASDTVGCVRHLTMPSGAKIREKLIALSYDEHMYKYSIIKAPMPVENYEGKLRLLPITDGNRTYVEWSSEFDVPKGEEADVVAEITGIYISGLDALKRKFGG